MVLDLPANVVGDAIHVLILLFGVGFVWQAVSLFRHQRTLSNLETSATGSVREGLVAVEGTIRGPLADDLSSPIRGRPGVLAKWLVEEYAGHEAGVGGGWTEFGSGYDSVPFVVDDGSGPVVVEIDGEEALRRLELDFDGFDDAPALEIDVDERPPNRIRQFLETHDVRDQQSQTKVPTSEDGDEQGDRRYYETVLDSGDEVYVVGIASERADAETDASATISPPSSGESGTFYLSDRGRSGVLRQRLGRVAVMAVVGALVVWYELSRFVPGVQFVAF